MLKKAIITAFSLILWTAGTVAIAQDYQTGVGLRAGVSTGLTVKHFLTESAAIEGILHSRWKGLLVTGLYEVHRDIRELPGLRWFYGGGAHIGTWNGNKGHPSWRHQHNGYTVFGLDGIIGLDYGFDNAPINLSLDYKPAVNFSNVTGFWGDGVAVSIRFSF